MNEDLHPELTTSVAVTDGHAVLTATGEVDLYTAPRFAEALTEAATAAPRILVDLTDVSFMDSTGLRCLLQARSRADQCGGGVAVRVTAGSAVARLLDLAGVSDLFASPENPA